VALVSFDVQAKVVAERRLSASVATQQQMEALLQYLTTAEERAAACEATKRGAQAELKALQGRVLVRPFMASLK
jgi:hypothetical protein